MQLIFINTCDKCDQDYDAEYLDYLMNGICSNCQPYKDKNNETYGVLAEYTICKLSRLECHINPSRIILGLLTEDFFKCIRNILSQIPKLNEFVGGTSSIDFVTVDAKTVSIKTNISVQRKVCPQKIGQPTLRKFCEHFMLYEKHITTNKAKRYILEHPKTMVKEYIKYLFCCDITIWIRYYQNGWQYGIFDITKFIDFKDNLFSFTHDWTMKRSNTLKYDRKSIGEFQIHGNRDNIKFRFNMKNLVKFMC